MEVKKKTHHCHQWKW